MTAAAGLLERRSDELGRVITAEMGKPLAAAIAEVKKCATACRYYAAHAEEHLADEPVKTEAAQSFIRYEPIGPVLAVMPWNFPFWQVFRFAAPALMAGTAGASVASAAGKAIKKVVLELGGSDPFIVMPSADLDRAAEIGVKARIVNNGQSCIAAKRFIVHQSIAEAFEAKFVKAMEALKVGDPFDPATDVGPLATPQIVSDIEKQVRQSVAAGARLLTGGRRLGERGNFYAPTVLTDIPDGAPAACEETFGPVASLFRVNSIEDAIAKANDTTFGLGASVWTNDRAEIDRFIDGIESGQVFVNAMVASDPRMPFGGVKHSGFGRELGAHGIREFVNIKTVWVAAVSG